MTTTGNRKARIALVSLMLLFFAPVLVAWLLYSGLIDWQPGGSAANGELITPPMPLPEHTPVYVINVYEDEFLRKRWALVYVAGAQCLKACETSLLTMRQVRLSLGKYMDRIARVMMVPSEQMVTERIRVAFPGMEIVIRDSLSDKILGDTSSAAGESIYLVDPLGNLMMRFEKNQDPREMHEDLQRLLKLSRIG